MAARLACSYCGHAADHPHPCPRTITTRTGEQSCPCTRHHAQGEKK